MKTKTKITFDKEETGLLLSAIDTYDLQDWTDGCYGEGIVRVMNKFDKFICRLRETDKMQLIIKSEE